MYFAGPLKLKQGGAGILGRLPVFQDNEFWAFQP
jgi:sensor domain CHASE-containing protein